MSVCLVPEPVFQFNKAFFEAFFFQIKLFKEKKTSLTLFFFNGITEWERKILSFFFIHIAEEIIKTTMA